MRVTLRILAEKAVVASQAAAGQPQVPKGPPKFNKLGEPLRVKEVRPAILSRLVEKGGVWFFNNVFNRIPMGVYPPGYDRDVHGPYMHWRYYGKPDTPFGEVKLSELPAWLKRRDMGAVQTLQMVGRAKAYWDWRFNDIAPFNGGNTQWLQWIMGMVVFWTILTWPKMRIFKKYRYHW